MLEERKYSEEYPEHKIRNVKLGISMGDINGIGMEVIFKTFEDPKILESCTPVLFGSSKIVSYYKKALDMNDFPVTIVKSARDAVARKFNLVNVIADEVKIDMGLSTPIAGDVSLKSLDAALEELSLGNIEALVTAPLNKYNIQSKNFNFAGHTDYLAKKANCNDYLMLLVANNLKVGVVTGHIPISHVSEALSIDLVYSKIKVLHNCLRSDFTYSRPRIAVLGLNPHAGDNGVIGDEEQKYIIPAIKKAFDEKILVFGPYPADGYFGNEEYKKFSATLAIYHDQGLIPFKTLAFDTGVNFTAGLPYVRTSPDHGTGYDLAGKNLASPNSFRQAVYMACDIFRNRRIYNKYAADPLRTNIAPKHNEADITLPTSDDSAF